VPFKPSTLALALILSAGAVASGQDTAPDPFSTARFRFGAVAMSPGVAVTNLGWDSNVFNSWDNPQGDFTFTTTPQTDVWVRMGDARIKAHASVGYVYFAQFAEERSWNTDDSIRVDVPFVHFRPYAGYSYLNIRDRPGYEIDTRVRRQENAAFAGLDLPLTRKTTIGGSFKRTRTDYDEGESFNGSYLRYQFNRTTDVSTGSLRYALTPLTTLLFDADYVQERFEFASARDSQGMRILPGVDFKPLALISGTAHVGFRQLNFDDPTMPDYTGPVASVNLGYTLMGITRFSVQVDRDVQYSYELFEPYYLLTGITGTVTQKLNVTWDLQARAGNQRLDYQQAILPSASSPGNTVSGGRQENVIFYGGGVGYRLGTDVRIGFNVDYYTRHSDRTTRQYEGFRAGTSVTYGF
jgi:hypothetical protein